MTATAEQRRIIRAYARNRDMRYRITSEGEVHMHGKMPNSNETGWWLFAQSIDNAVAMIRRDY